MISALGRGDYQSNRDYDASFGQDRGQDRDRPYDYQYDDYYGGPRDDYEREPGPDRGRGGSDFDMRRGGPGSGSEMGRGGPDFDMRRGGPGPDMERGGPDYDMRGGDWGSDMERGGPDFDMRRRGPESDFDRGGPNFDMRREGPEMERDPYQDQPVEEDVPEISTNFPDEEEREVWGDNGPPKDSRGNELHQQGSRGDFGRERREADRYVS